MTAVVVAVIGARPTLADDATPPDAPAWQAGVAKISITPPEPMPMAGYASRGDKHAESTLTDLWAKALVLQDAQGNRGLLITLDIIGLDRGLSEAICRSLQDRFKLRRDQIALCASHTHTGPVVAENLRPMHYKMLDADNRQRVEQYADLLKQRITEVARQAMDEKQPARLAWGSETCTVAVNRRNNPAGDVPELRRQGKLRGPVDHDVPVLAVLDPSGAPRAVVFGYACHCTVLSSLEWSGDYAGFAQIEVEKTHPGCVAMFWAGCGADQNPLPRRQVELAREYGRRLGEAVCRVLPDGENASQLTPVAPTLSTAYREIDLPLDDLPSRADLEEQTRSSNKYVVARAEQLIMQVDAGKPLSPTYPFPIGVWRLGDDVAMVVLGGEVVVDYALRLKRDFGRQSLGGRNVWVVAYVNDVMAYIPSERVREEGGYEADGAMVYYGLPTGWAEGLEQRIVDTVGEMVQ